MKLIERTYPIKLNKDYYVVTANDLIKGRQKMSLREAQLLYIAMSQVVKEDKEFKTYTVPVTQLASFMGMSGNSLYRDLEHVCTDLLKRVVKIQIKDDQDPQERKWKAFQWISCASYENGKLTIKLNDELKPFLIDLVSRYSQILLGALCSFRSYYTARLYQLLVCEANENPHNSKDEWTFTCDQIRDFFQLEADEYPRAYDLINKMFKVSLQELTDSDFAYIWNVEDIRDAGRGRPLVGIKFNAITFKNKDEKDLYMKHLGYPPTVIVNMKPRKSKKANQVDENQITLDMATDAQII